MKWWRVVAFRQDYLHGGVGCYEKKADAEQAMHDLNAERTDDIRRAGITFGIQHDGDAVSVPVSRSAVLQWAKSLLPVAERRMRP